MLRLEFILHRDGEPPFRFFSGELEPGEIASLFTAAVKLLEADGATGYVIETRHVPQPEQERDP